MSPSAFRRRARSAHLPQVSPSAFRAIAIVSVACYALLVVTGGAVRLTGSGLGCLDWPTCSHASVTPTISFHPLVEFSNRMVSVAVTVVSIVAFLAALRRAPRRSDLVKLASGLVVGLLAQIVLGGIVVLTKLNPYFVAVHFVLTLAVLADAVVLLHRATHADTPAEPAVGSDLVWLARILLGTVTLLVCVGTIVTGAGPHAGGPGAKRVPIAFQEIAEFHSDIALFLIGATLATLFALHHAKAPAAIQRRARTVLEVLALQGALGYTQYFLHDNAFVVELHLAGATSVWCAMLAFYLGLHRHPAAVVPAQAVAAATDQAPVAAPAHPGVANAPA